MTQSAQPVIIAYRAASPECVDRIQSFLQSFVDRELLLPRTREELSHLSKHAFMALVDDDIVGFAAVEIYSRKLAEIQCLAVSPDYQRNGIGKKLVGLCVGRAKEQNVLELMAISASDEFLKTCGFDYSLPMQKRALFVEPQVAADDQIQKLD